MMYEVFSIRDKYTTFMQPTLDQNEDSAKRAFSYAINNSPELSYSPSDFDLYKIAKFDSVSGEIAAVQPIKFICNGMEVFNEKSQS